MVLYMANYIYMALYISYYIRKNVTVTDGRQGEAKFRFRYVTLRWHRVYDAEVSSIQLETETGICKVIAKGSYFWNH